MTNDIWVFPLEPLDGRYTKQWFEEIPRLLSEKLMTTTSNVFNVTGNQRSDKPTTGAFLDFADTNYWKSTQLANFIEELHEGKVKDDAHILFTDFWNPAILQIAYMRDLLDKKWVIHGIAHAGAYDPTDILGIKMRKPWPYEAEKAFFYACDYVYFGTKFHANMFARNLQIPESERHRIKISGQPHDAIIRHTNSIPKKLFEDREWDVIWPHRYNVDKQPDIAESLADEFNVLITQKRSLSKDEYYHAMANSKIIFSCSLHENLGISIMEGVLLGAIPLVPDRCSYSEMYLAEFKYPSEWTENSEKFAFFRPRLVNRLNTILKDPHHLIGLLAKQREILINNYMTADKMIECLTNTVKEKVDT